MHDLPQQLDHGVQPGLGPDEGSALEGRDPRVGLLERWCDLVVDFVIAGGIEAPQIGGVGGRPVLQVGSRLLRIPRLAALGGELDVQSVQMVVQRRRGLACWARAPVALDEEHPEEGQDQRGVADTQQSPRGMPLPQCVDRCVLHQGRLKNTADRILRARLHSYLHNCPRGFAW